MGPATQDRHSLSQTERPVLPDRRRNTIIVQRIAILPSYPPPPPPRAPEGWNTGFAKNIGMCLSSALVLLSKSIGTAAGLGGAAGTAASFGEQGLAVQERLASELDLTPMAVPSRTTGDHLTEYVLLLGLVAGTCGKLGHEIYELMKQEFGEVEEPVPPGTVGSSTMPQKRNPKLSQDLMAMTTQVRALVPVALEAMLTEHEADRTTSDLIHHALHESCALTGDILERVIAVAEGLQVFPERMLRNLDASFGLVYSQRVLLALVEQGGMQRDSAYKLVQAHAMTAWNEERAFLDLLSADPTVTSNLSPDQLQDCFDADFYLRNIDGSFERLGI